MTCNKYDRCFIHITLPKQTTIMLYCLWHSAASLTVALILACSDLSIFTYLTIVHLPFLSILYRITFCTIDSGVQLLLKRISDINKPKLRGISRWNHSFRRPMSSLTPWSSDISAGSWWRPILSISQQNTSLLHKRQKNSFI